MAQRLEQIERRTTGSDLAQLDNAIIQSQREAEHWKSQQAQAITNNNGAAAADASEKMIAARERAAQLASIKKNVTSAPQRQSPTAPDPLVVAQAQKWNQDNSWYDPAGGDIDSRITLELDRELTKEGFNPRTPEYWDELNSRVSKYLPHRAGSSRTGANGGIVGLDTRGKPTRSVVPGGTREVGSTAGSGFVLSAARVQALKEAGMWDDPKARNDMIKRYRDQDRAQKR